jgi:hypothetical protein
LNCFRSIELRASLAVISCKYDFSALLPLALKGESRKINLHPLGTGVNQVDFSMFSEFINAESKISDFA